MRTRVTLRRGSWEREAVVEVPAGPCRPDEIVPALHQLAAATVSESTANVSCTAGCGACCRQLVPVTTPEVGFLQRVAAAQPSEEREQIRGAAERADDALARLGFGPAGELCELNARESRLLAEWWFRLGRPCPFLVEESCSIHAQRPLACREYLVTSPPSACAAPGRGLIKRVRQPVSVWSRVARSGSARPRWLPMSAALTTDVPDGDPVAGPDLLAQWLDASIR